MTKPAKHNRTDQQYLRYIRACADELVLAEALARDTLIWRGLGANLAGYFDLCIIEAVAWDTATGEDSNPDDFR